MMCSGASKLNNSISIQLYKFILGGWIILGTTRLSFLNTHTFLRIKAHIDSQVRHMGATDAPDLSGIV